MLRERKFVLEYRCRRSRAFSQPRGLLELANGHVEVLSVHSCFLFLQFVCCCAGAPCFAWLYSRKRVHWSAGREVRRSSRDHLESVVEFLHGDHSVVVMVEASHESSFFLVGQWDVHPIVRTQIQGLNKMVVTERSFEFLLTYWVHWRILGRRLSCRRFYRVWLAGR